MTSPAASENTYISTIESQDASQLKKAIAILRTTSYGTLSTVSADGLPWGSPLFFAVDEHLELYWSSAVVAQHSQNLAGSCRSDSQTVSSYGRAMFTLFQSSQDTGVQGVYLLGIAQEVNDFTQVEQVMQLMFAKAEKWPERTAVDYREPSSRRIYQFTIEQAWITGERLPDGNQLIDTKIALDVDRLRQMC